MIRTLFVYTLLLLFMEMMMMQANKFSPYSVIGRIKNNIFSYRLYFILASLSFAIVFGIRYDVGVDHLTYVNDYIYGAGRTFEVLYRLLNNIFVLLNLPYPLFFTLLSFLQITLFLLAFRKEQYLYPFLIIFLFFGLIEHWNNIIRVSLAFCVWLYSLNYIAEKKLSRYLLCSLLAIGFHVSSIILVVAYPLLMSGKNYFSKVTIQYILLAIAFIGRLLFWNFASSLEGIINLFIVITGSYEGYSVEKLLYESVGTSVGTGLGFIADLIVNLIIIALSPQVCKFYNSRKFFIIYNLFFVGLLFQYVFPDGFLSLTRPFRYFYMIRPIMLSYFAYYLYKSRKFIELFLYVFLFAGIFYAFIITSNKSAHLWYQTYSEHREMPLEPFCHPKSLLDN